MNVRVFLKWDEWVCLFSSVTNQKETWNWRALILVSGDFNVLYLMTFFYFFFSLIFFLTCFFLYLRYFFFTRIPFMSKGLSTCQLNSFKKWLITLVVGAAWGIDKLLVGGVIPGERAGANRCNLVYVLFLCTKQNRREGIVSKVWRHDFEQGHMV